MEKTVLCYIEKNDEYLMLLRCKKQNDINNGKWIGVGGHIEENESSQEAIIREIKEETGLVAKVFLVGKLAFYYDGILNEESDVYVSNSYKGKLKECDEGVLHFISKNDILSLNLWEGDRLFLPKIINKDYGFNYKFFYDKNNKLVRSEYSDL